MIKEEVILKREEGRRVTEVGSGKLEARSGKLEVGKEEDGSRKLDDR